MFQSIRYVATTSAQDPSVPALSRSYVMLDTVKHPVIEQSGRGAFNLVYRIDGWPYVMKKINPGLLFKSSSFQHLSDKEGDEELIFQMDEEESHDKEHQERIKFHEYSQLQDAVGMTIAYDQPCYFFFIREFNKEMSVEDLEKIEIKTQYSPLGSRILVPFFEGETLYDAFFTAKNLERIEMLIAAAQALQDIQHHDLVHGDFKSSNLIWHKDQIRIIDFAEHGKRGQPIRTIRKKHPCDYWPPERTSDSVDTIEAQFSMDIYSFAQMLLSEKQLGKQKFKFRLRFPALQKFFENLVSTESSEQRATIDEIIWALQFERWLLSHVDGDITPEKIYVSIVANQEFCKKYSGLNSNLSVFRIPFTHLPTARNNKVSLNQLNAALFLVEKGMTTPEYLQKLTYPNRDITTTDLITKIMRDDPDCNPTVLVQAFAQDITELYKLLHHNHYFKEESYTPFSTIIEKKYLHAALYELFSPRTRLTISEYDYPLKLVQLLRPADNSAKNSLATLLLGVDEQWLIDFSEQILSWHTKAITWPGSEWKRNLFNRVFFRKLVLDILGAHQNEVVDYFKLFNLIRYKMEVLKSGTEDDYLLLRQCSFFRTSSTLTACLDFSKTVMKYLYSQCPYLETQPKLLELLKQHKIELTEETRLERELTPIFSRKVE